MRSPIVFHAYKKKKQPRNITVNRQYYGYPDVIILLYNKQGDGKHKIPDGVLNNSEQAQNNRNETSNSTQRRYGFSLAG